MLLSIALYLVGIQVEEAQTRTSIISKTPVCTPYSIYRHSSISIHPASNPSTISPTGCDGGYLQAVAP